MKTPESLEQLIEFGIIDEVIRPLMSGKEAQIYVVRTGGQEAVAKVYKEASQRTFKHRAEYTEGRRTRNTRDQRAINKRTQHGRKQDEAAWRNAEVDMISRARRAEVRVPEAINFVDGVLVMELVKDEHGDPAPRLGDLSFSAEEALEIYRGLIQGVVRLLCAGVIHGDLSDFNVLMGKDGPVFIDFPQAVDPATNQNARKLLLRDVDNLHRFVERHAPEHRRRPFGQEMWSLYEANRLAPDTALAGNYRAPKGKANTAEVLALIADADAEEQERRDDRGEDRPLVARKPQRVVVDFTKEARPRKPKSGKSRARTARPAARNSKPAKPATQERSPANRRNRRRRSSGTQSDPRPQREDETASTRPGTAPTALGAASTSGTKRRRRGRGGRGRKPSSDARGDSQQAAPRTDGDRPARRRRRRPRSSGPRKPE